MPSDIAIHEKKGYLYSCFISAPYLRGRRVIEVVLMVGGSQVERLIDLVYCCHDLVKVPPAPTETEWARLALSQATCCVFFAGISVVNSFARLLCQIGALFLRLLYYGNKQIVFWMEARTKINYHV